MTKDQANELMFNSIKSSSMADLMSSLKNGADPDAFDQFGFTPLMRAVLMSDSAMINILLCSGADIDKPNKTGDTPLHMAAQMNFYEIAIILVEKGAYVHAVNIYGHTPYDCASANGHAVIAGILRSRMLVDTVRPVMAERYSEEKDIRKRLRKLSQELLGGMQTKARIPTKDSASKKRQG